MSQRTVPSCGRSRLVLLLFFATVLMGGCDGSRAKKESPKPDSGNSDQKTETPTDQGQETTVVEIDADLMRAFPDLPKPQDPGKPVLLRYKPISGNVWRYHASSAIKMDAMGMITTESGSGDLEFRLGDVGDDSFQVTGQIAEMVSDLKTAGGSLHLNTVDPDKQRADPPFRPILKIWDEVIQCNCSYHVNFAGQLQDFQVPERIETAVREHSGERAALTGESLSGNFIAAFVQLKSGPVSVGDQWEIQIVARPMNTTRNIATARFLGTAQVDGRECGLIEIRTHNGLPEDTSFFQKFEFATTSLVMFDLEAGNVWRRCGVVTGEMEVQVNNALIPQTSSGTTVLQRMDDDSQ